MTAIPASKPRRGQPLWALGGVLLCWIGVRAALFELPLATQALPVEAAGTIGEVANSLPDRQPIARTDGAVQHPVRQPVLARQFAPAPVSPVEYGPDPPALLARLPSPPSIEPETARRAAGHNLLWMAAMQAIPLLPEVRTALMGRGIVPAPAPPRGATAQPGAGRWSGDGWLVWRPGSRGLAAAGPVTPVYGGSQAGAVLRYDLAPGSLLRPAAYLRAVRALDAGREGDVAAGVALRPLAGVPVTAHGEARLSRRGASLALRPAAFVSAGVDAAPISAGITARGYAQAGYAGGRDATAFADGSLIAEKPVWRDRGTALTAGAGAWGGAQRGAARLDLGPAASLRFRLGEGTARLSADYRLRVAGNAEPAAGAALTLSAGF